MNKSKRYFIAIVLGGVIFLLLFVSLYSDEIGILMSQEHLDEEKPLLPHPGDEAIFTAMQNIERVETKLSEDDILKLCELVLRDPEIGHDIVSIRDSVEQRGEITYDVVDVLIKPDEPSNWFPLVSFRKINNEWQQVGMGSQHFGLPYPGPADNSK